jgi:beta-xylosidase
LVHNGVVYLYTSHDEDDAPGWFKMRDWRLYTSTDLSNWTDKGVVASLATFPWANQHNDAWAPQVVARNGKFYLYVPITVPGNPRNVIAVAVADRPEGPFKDMLGKPLVGPGEAFFDPTVFVDDDGQAYLYWGNTKLWYVKLNEDMVSTSGPITQIAGLSGRALALQAQGQVLHGVRVHLLPRGDRLCDERQAHGAVDLQGPHHGPQR